jgi:hypothetical protein
VTTGVSSGPPVDRVRWWLDHEYHVSDEHLGFIRVLYCAFVLFVIGVPSVTWIAGNPQLLFDPPLLSIANLFAGWPSDGVLWILSLSLVISFLLLLFGFFVPTVSVLVSLLLIVAMNLQFSFGKMDFNILLALAPLAMARSGWGNRYTLARGSSAPNRSGVCLGVLAIVVGFAMFTAGFQKVVGGWLDPRSQASYAHVVWNSYGEQRHALLVPLAMRLRSAVLWESLDYLTVGFEVLFLVAAIRRSWFRAWIGFAIIFHTSTLLVLDIGFSVIFAAYLVFFEWPLPRPDALSRRTLSFLAAGSSLLVLVIWWIGIQPNQPMFLRMLPSLVNYVVVHLVGPSNVDDTTLEILPTALGVMAAVLMLRRSAMPSLIVARTPPRPEKPVP